MDLNNTLDQGFADRLNRRSSIPPSMDKLAAALRELLTQKDFNSITAVEICRTAKVNEALLYRYFKDKRGVLHFVLHNYMIDFMQSLVPELRSVKGAINKLRVIIHKHTSMYDTNRVFAKILLLEVRNFSSYFESDTYELIKSYGRVMSTIINEGVERGEIRTDIPQTRIRNLIMGGIEHACMSPVIFGYSIEKESIDDLCTMLFKGIASSA